MMRLNEIWPDKTRTGKRRNGREGSKEAQLTSTPTPKSDGISPFEPVVSPVAGDGNKGNEIPDSPELLKDKGTEQLDDDDSNEELDVKKSFRELKEWGLYPSVVKWYEGKGLTSLFDWQRDCLRKEGVLDGRNLFFSAPTSAGKTMVADILTLKQVFNKRKKVLIVLPFISIVREKINDLENMLSGTHIRTGAFMGSFHTKGGFDAVDIAVTTFEKANGYINRLCQENRLDQLGAVIVDEIHLIADSNRGYLLELMLAKIMMANTHGSSLSPSSSIQIVGMSATLPNVDDLGKWLDAVVYKTDFRPVPLTQMIQLGKQIINVETQEVVETLPDAIKEETKLRYMTMKCIADNISVLVFHNNKAEIENMAKLLANQIKNIMSQNEAVISANKKKLREVVHKLQNDSIPIIKAQLNNSSIKADEDLLKAIEFGVAFHHAGLPMEHREIVEESFKRGFIKVLFATSTLCSGVNLPARKVLIKSPCRYGNKMIDVLMYRQMIGRAGRKGMDERGESVLLCSNPTEEEIGKLLTKAVPTKITSCLTSLSENCLQRALVEAVVIGLVKTDEDVDDYLNCTLAMSQADDETKLWLEEQSAEAMKFLTHKDHCFIAKTERDEDSGCDLKAGQLGQAVVAAGLPPAEGLQQMRLLEKARRGIVLNGDVHLLFLIIPDNSIRNVKVRSDLLKKLLMDFLDGGEYEHCKDVMNKLGFSYNSKALSREFVEEINYKRFFVSLALNDLIKEIPIHELTPKYGLEKGMLQSLQTSVSVFAGMVSSFCNKIRWSQLELLFRHLEARIEFGVQPELIDIMRIPSMTVRVARRLYDANIDTVKEIAHATPAKILQILEKTVELQTTSPLRRLSAMMWIEAHKRAMTLSEIADHLVSESRSIIEKDVGSVDWDVGQKIASSQEVFKTPQKGGKKKKKQTTPARPLPMENICKSMKNKGPSVSIGRNSLYTDENLSTQHDVPVVTPVKAGSEDSGEMTPVKSVVSSETSPTTSASSSVVPKVLFSNAGDCGRKRAATPDVPISEIPKSKRRLDQMSVLASEFCHNVKPGPVARTNIGSEESMKNLIAVWKNRKFAGIECDVIWCQPAIPEIGSRPSDQPKTSDLYDGILFQDEMKALTRIAICLADNESFSITGREKLTSFGRMLKEQMCDGLSVTAFDVKHVYRVLRECFFIERESLTSIEWFDLKICHWLRDPEAQPEPTSAHQLLKLYDGLDAYMPFSEHQDGSLSFNSAILFPLRNSMQRQVLENHNFFNVFEMIEMPVAMLMAEVERKGLEVDRTYLVELAKEAFRVKRGLEVKALSVTGLPKLNMKNVPQLRNILFNKLNLLSLIPDSEIDKNAMRVKKMKETKGLPDHLSTSKRILTVLAKFHPFPALITEHRKVSSARTKTINHIDDYCDEHKTNKIYCKVNLFSATGRIHMKDPDLQHTANTFTTTHYKTDGTEASSEINVRKIFIPTQGYQFVSADYRQLELRILAHLCQDNELVRLINAGRDVFTELAAQLNRKETDDVTHDERQHAKTLVYGVIYGMGKKLLAQRLEVSEDEAKEFRDNFHNTFPGIQLYIDGLISDFEKNGFIETLLGRKRLIPAIASDASDERSRALRQAVHTTVQGSAADLVKLAMIHVDRQICQQKLSAFLVHEMHDELIYEVSESDVKSFVKMISQTMQNVAKSEFPGSFAIDLPVKVRKGPNWGELEDATEDL